MSKASVQFMIPAEARRRLVQELGYKEEEVRVMDPSLGMKMLEKGIKRPWGAQPMPQVRERNSPRLHQGVDRMFQVW